MRVSQQWENIQAHIWHGYGHDLDKTPDNGGLVEFCAACAQPGINLPSDWRTQKDQ